VWALDNFEGTNHAMLSRGLREQTMQCCPEEDWSEEESEDKEDDEEEEEW
jgi:hypothetical protein